jgi:hypothetical protein
MKILSRNLTLIRCICLLTLVLGVTYNSYGQAGRIVRFAGGGWLDSTNGIPALDASIYTPSGIGMDAVGNFYYVDANRFVVRKIEASSGLVYTIAGMFDVYGRSGDGGPATAASFSYINGFSVNAEGNIYITDDSLGTILIRKVDGTTGIITTVAGGGSDTTDGVPATAASIGTLAVVADNSNNLYFESLGRIRKVDASTGLISTIAGNPRATAFGDGGPATAARIHQAVDIQLDNANNIYMTTSRFSIRKINVSTGIINTVVGGGSDTTNGIPATNAFVDQVEGFSVDGGGNIFFTEYNYKLIRYVNASTGLIQTIAGGDTCTADSSLPRSSLIYPFRILANPSTGNIYFSERLNSLIKKFSFSPLVPFTYNPNFYSNIHKRCRGPQLTARTRRYHSSLRVRTDFGDGTMDTSSFRASWSGVGGYVLINHDYTSSRTYTITQVLDSAGAPYDTVTYTYNHAYCSDMSVSFYNDIDADCVKDSTEPYIMRHLVIEVDSNSIPIDTVFATSGFSYTAYGNPRDIYRFKIISTPAGLVTSCPSTGYIYDTLHAGVTTNTPLRMALACTSVSNVDLEVRSMIPITRPDEQWGYLYLRNNYCPPANGTVTLHFSPKYVYAGGAFPVPSSTTASSLTWNVSALSDISAGPTSIYFPLIHNSAMSYPSDGDTVNERITITPTSGPPDVNMANNVVVRVDTVRTSRDPNAMEVVPSCFDRDTTFLFTVHFENIGSVAAENIYVMDTLSRSFDPSSIEIKMSSHPMFVTKYMANGSTIVKFDFPNINLADSSDHLHRDGVFMYTIKNKPSLPRGLVLKSQVGIYFDYNDVLMTNQANVTQGCPVPVSVSDVKGSDVPVTLHPNPATDELTITSPANKYQSISISNMLGKRIMTLKMSKPTTTIDVSALPAGMYIVTLNGGSGSEVKRFVKQ